MFFRTLLVIGALLVSAPVAHAATYPAPVGYVNDFAHILKAETVQSLEAELTQFDASTTIQVAVVTVPNMGGDYVEHYAPELFKTWGIGTKAKDTGVLLLVALNERKIRVEVGYGLEGALPDSVAQKIISDEISPALKAGNYDDGVTAGVHALLAAVQNEYSAPAGRATSVEDYATLVFFALVLFQWLAAILARSRSVWLGGVVGGLGGAVLATVFSWWVVGGVLATLLLALLGVAFDLAVSGAYASARTSGTTPPWWTGGSGGFGSSGGGFGGFGGGSSGGGGASSSF